MVVDTIRRMFTKDSLYYNADANATTCYTSRNSKKGFSTFDTN